MYKKGKIFNIQRFSTSDGPGIRTVVFFMGCPLDCAWCHNPESKTGGEEEKTAEEIIDIVLRDMPFYEESGGGLTLSGGEPLMQFDFALSLLKLAKERGVHTAIETCGFTSRDLSKLVPYTDLWLYDIKLFPAEEHVRHTGVTNKHIFENLYLLDCMGANIVLRCPIIPNINMTEEHFDSLGQLANSLKGVTAIHLEPYHPLGISKAQKLGKVQA